MDLRKVLSTAQLPALPQSAIRLLELSRDANTGPAELSVPIEADGGLTSQVLRFVNSSYFGFSRRIASVKTAITLVGIRTIRDFALWSAVFSLVPDPKCGPFDLKSLWQDSLRRALLARAAAKLLGMTDAEEPFAAALLQDMAIPVLAAAARELYNGLLQVRAQRQIRLSDLEIEVFGWSHADVAGLMARHWNLPGQFADLIETHLTVESLLAQPGREPARLAVALSALLPAGSDPLWGECAAFAACYQQAAPPGSPAVEAMLGQIDEEFARFAPVLRMSVPAKSLLDRYQEAAVPVA
jgi:HD-like signal output (HDOD) protein